MCRIPHSAALELSQLPLSPFFLLQQHRRYPVKFQKEVVAWYDAYRKQHGVSIVDTARAFNVPRGTVAFWIYVRLCGLRSTVVGVLDTRECVIRVRWPSAYV